MVRPIDPFPALRDAAARFRDFVAGWPADTEAENGMTKDDADVVSAHIDRVLLFSGPGAPPLVPEDDGLVAAAFANFASFAAAWPADRTDPATQLTRADLDLIGKESGPARPHWPPVLDEPM